MSTEQDPAPQDPAPEPDPQSDPTPEPQPAAKEDKTFTQEEVNRIVKERAERMIKQNLGDGYNIDDLPKLKDRLAEAESEQERAIREAREQAANEVKGQYQTRAIRDAARAAAAGKWEYPDQAAVLVDLSDLDPDAADFDGQVAERLDAFLADHPRLAVSTETPSGSQDAGSRTPPSQPAQLSRADLADMAPEDINKARLDGRLDELMGTKP